jgi:hypothetical protein
MTRYYLAECQDCTPTLPVPFLEQPERDKWASVHSDVLGHSVLVYTEEKS